MANELVLAIDIGSSSVRASIYDASGGPVPRTEARIARTFETSPDGASEMDVARAFNEVVEVIDGCVAASEAVDGTIEHVAIAAFWHSLLGLDQQGNPTTPVMGWADTRSRAYSAVLKQRFDEAEVHDRTGAHFHSSFWPAKLLWLRNEQPEVWARTARWVSFSDYVHMRLCGEIVTSISMASGTGIFDQRRCDWDAELLKYLKIRRSQLPEIADDGATFEFAEKYTDRWPRLRSALVFPAVADGIADHIGSCGTQENRASLMVGTSAAMRVVSPGDPPSRIPDGLWCYRIDRPRLIVGGALSNGGNLIAQVGENFDVPKDAENEMRRRGAADHGLIVLPFFFGERSTGYREDASGAILGLTASHDATDILQASMEAIAFRFVEICDRLENAIPIEEIVVSGGALSSSPVWTQIIADVLGRDMILSTDPESASRGAVLLALESLGKIDISDRFSTPIEGKLTFHPECHERYKTARRQHQLAYDQFHGKN